MTRPSLLAALAAAALATALAPAVLADPPASSCTTNCHGLESTALASSAHANALGCVDCHGGDPKALRDKEKSHDPAAGFVGKHARTKIPSLCGDCHSDAARMRPYDLPTDQLAHYKTSNHGKALFGKGDESVAVCTDCHGAHGILSPKDPTAPTAPENQPETCGKCHSDAQKMKPYGLPTEIPARFLRSVHGKALLVDRTRGAPSCSACHGSHGAAPPGVTDIVQVCAHCHGNTGEEYRKSPHFTSGKMTCVECHEEKVAKDPTYRRSGCTACHDSHEMLAPGDAMYHGNEVGHCGHCHRQVDRAEKLESAILSGRAKLTDAMTETRRELADAKAKGLFLEGEKVFLKDSERILVSVRPLIHSMDEGAIVRHLDDGIARQERTREQVEKKTHVLRDRKIFTVVGVLVLLLLAALFIIKREALESLS